MKLKAIITFSIFFINFIGYTQLASWSLTSDGAPSYEDPNISAGNFTSFGIEPITFSSSGASTYGFGNINLPQSQYFEASITPISGKSINISEIHFSESRSANGATSFFLAYSLDNINFQYLMYIESIPDNTDERNRSATGLNINVPEGNTIKFRWTAFAEDISGTWEIGANSLNIIGSIGSSPSGPANPIGFSISSPHDDELNLSWNKNANNNNVMIAYDPEWYFAADPSGSYEVGDYINDNVVVVYKGDANNFDQTGLVSNWYYPYKIWSYDESLNYSTGVTYFKRTPASTDLMITEIMQNPSAVPDSDGEWFEIINYGSNAVNLSEYIILDYNSGEQILLGENIEPNAFVVFGKSNQNTNGGHHPDYEVSSNFILPNTSGSISLQSPNHTVVDIVQYDESLWPDPTGASMVFNGTSSDDNNSPSNWTTATLREQGYNSTETDLGSPGTNGHQQKLISETTWTGSGNWSEGNLPDHANWSHGIPWDNTNVIIDGNITVDAIKSNPAICHDLTINNSKSVTIDENKALSINGNYNNTNGNLTLKSSDTGDGSIIIEGSMSGEMNIERYISAYSGNEDGWHLLSSPRTSSFNLATSDFVPVSGDDDVFSWNETEYLWENYWGTSNPNFNFIPGKAYLTAYKTTSPTRVFEGEMNHSNITFENLTLTENSSNTDFNGWHLLGNPFQSAIIWNDGNWNLSNINTIAKIYNESSGNYIDISSNDIIPINQGFFVQVNHADGGNITIPLDSRTHDDTPWYKSEKLELQKISLKVLGGSNTFFDETCIQFSHNATMGFDTDLDSYKMYGMNSAPQLYTSISNSDYSTNSLPFNSEKMLVPLNFKAGTDGEYILEITNNTNNKIYLEDKFTTQIFDISNLDHYNFNAQTDDIINRFIVHINGVTGIENKPSTKNYHVYNLMDAIYIENPDLEEIDISVHNYNGQLLYLKQSSSEKIEKINLKNATGIYMVSITAAESAFFYKVFLK